MIRRPPRSTQSRSSAASDVYKRQLERNFIADVERGTSGCAVVPILEEGVVPAVQDAVELVLIQLLKFFAAVVDALVDVTKMAPCHTREVRCAAGTAVALVRGSVGNDYLHESGHPLIALDVGLVSLATDLIGGLSVLLNLASGLRDVVLMPLKRSHEGLAGLFEVTSTLATEVMGLLQRLVKEDVFATVALR